MNINDYRFTPADYESLTYNVTTVDADRDLLLQFAGLNNIPELQVNLEVDFRNLIIRYIILFYDRNTPLKRIEKENDRKMYAALMAGIEYNDKTGKFSPETENIFRCKDVLVNKMILGFVRHFGSVQYSTLIVGYEMYYQKLLAAQDHTKKGPQAEVARGKLWEQAVKMRGELEVMAEKLLTEQNPFLKEDLYLMVNADINRNLMIFPEERIAARPKADG